MIAWPYNYVLYEFSAKTTSPTKMRVYVLFFTKIPLAQIVTHLGINLGFEFTSVIIF